MSKKADFIAKADSGYELIDSGEGEKLERFGEYILRRPDPQALWQKKLGEDIWNENHGHFLSSKTGGSWKNKKVPEKWTAKIADITFELSLSTFKHVGVFPEQMPNWLWMRDVIKNAGRPIKVLNLFGYTGGATISALLAGASVTHIDASKVALTSANRNAELSGVSGMPVRWIPEDARKFVEREIRRGSKYDAIIMDPPSFGHGAKNELWKIEDDLLPLIQLTSKILSNEPLFYILNGYASGFSPAVYKQNIDWLEKEYGGNIEYGELLIEERGGDRHLPAGICARYSK